jgi:hypothetical protein
MVTPPVQTYSYGPCENPALRLGVSNTMFLTPPYRNLSQGCITISVPILSHPIHLNAVLETPERSSTAYGVAQLIPYVRILYRGTELLHDAVFIDLKSVGQRQIVLRFHNIPRDTNRVMLPFGEVFERFVVLRST